MKKFAFTLAELTICIVALLILCAASMTVTKNININKSKIYIFAALRNLTMGNIAISEMEVNNGSFYPSEGQAYDADASKTNDWYCIYLSDPLSLVENPTCAKNTSEDTVNLRFPTGTTFKGIASQWQNAYKDLFYKDILIDADGEEGMNKLGVDQYPFRIFRGANHAGTIIDGMIYPVECGNDKMYYKDGDSITSTTLSSPYCYGKSNKIASDDSVITYNIFKVTDGERPNKATMVGGRMSTIEADCKAFGGLGFYHGRTCAEYGFKLMERCAHESTCEICEEHGTCPNGGSKSDCDTLATNNMINAKQEDGTYVKTGFQCFTLLNTPTSGLGVVGSAIFGDMSL